MASFKILLYVVFFAAVALGNVIPNTRREHNIDECENPPAKNRWTPFYSTTVEASAQFLKIVTRELKWPQGGEAPGRIKCIRVTDLIGDGTGGYATLKDGGLDFNHVTVHMESQRSHGLLFKVQIMGEPAEPIS